MLKLFKKKLSDTNKNGEEYYVKKSKISVGRYTYGYKTLNLIEYGAGKDLYIGNFTSIGPGVKIFLENGAHDNTLMSTYPFKHMYKDIFEGDKHSGSNFKNNKGDVRIGNDVWIGMDVLILNGVKISDGAIIGANSVVTKDVLPYEFVAGNPAKSIRFRFEKNEIELLLKLKWWELEDKCIKELVSNLLLKPDANKLKELILKYR